MKNALFTLILLVTLHNANAQKYTGTIDNHSKGAMDIVLTMFGLDNLVKIGELKANGDFIIDLSMNPTDNLSKEDLDTFFSPLRYGFQYTCGNPDDFSEYEQKVACDAGYIALWQDNTWAGALFPVSDAKLQLWMDDNGYNDAVEGSFFKVLVMTEAVDIQKNCTIYDYYDEKDIKVDLEYDIKLTKGLNLVRYQFESIYKTDPNVRAAFPIKVKMTEAGDNPNIIWVAKYFY